MTSLIERVGPARYGFLLSHAVLLLVTGCGDQDRTQRPPTGQPLTAGLALSNLAAGAGDTVAVQVLVRRDDSEPLATVQGELRFDPATLRFIGQPVDSSTFVLVGDTDAESGLLRIVSLRLGGLPDAAAEVRFEVKRAGYAAGLGYRFTVAAGVDRREFRDAEVLALQVSGATAPGAVHRVSLVEWAGRLGVTLSERPRINSAGDGFIYGDVTLSGNVNVLDHLGVAALAVNLRPLLTDPTKDYAVAGDVAPANLPGLGEATDALPPGQEPDGSHTINALDLLAIARENVALDDPIVGSHIPGRAARPFRAILSGDITSDRSFFRDTVYELHGIVNVPGSVTLTIQAGTRIEGDGATGARLVIRRGGNINWIGTRLEPIVFTCTAPTKTPGCWGGVVINGLSLLNNAQTGSDSLTICPEKASIGNPGRYGGCLVEDDAGTMRYVRVEYGGMSGGEGFPTPGLALLGVGSGTVIENVQVHASLGDGLFLSGGTVNLRHLVITANLGTGFRWDDGYGGGTAGGNTQFLIVQQPANGGDGIRGSNWAVDPNAGPRSRPRLYNVTVVGAGAGAGSGRGVVFENGSGGALRNTVILQSSGSGLDLMGAATCDQTGAGNLELDHSIFFGSTPDFSADNDCIDESAFGLEPVRANRVTDPALVAAGNSLTPDWRPVMDGAATHGFITPPSNLFFDTTVEFVGAVDPANIAGTNIPWYAGWTRGWTGAP